MSLFSKKAYANIDDVTQFRDQVTSFEELCYRIFPNLVNSMTQMYETALKRAESAEKTAP